MHGANKQNRTADLRVTNPLLYQLSYIGIFSCEIYCNTYQKKMLAYFYSLAYFLCFICHHSIRCL